ncbi:hypothetical protein PR003_g34169 [Phytophthora rubi]|uniref:Uncharacterized protein n=1 Tax=Phytophthora rubi TaxID=129364 RepID=A0A6A4AML6_9STRA|nr:hypothetical protein PR003_g34169 [Phytophthora rubi]
MSFSRWVQARMLSPQLTCALAIASCRMFTTSVVQVSASVMSQSAIKVRTRWAC